jgi:hypothetical protein
MRTSGRLRAAAVASGVRSRKPILSHPLVTMGLWTDEAFTHRFIHRETRVVL